MKYRKKPVVIDAELWKIHGDHPKVEVYNYRRSGVSSLSLTVCAHCGSDIHMKMGSSALHTHGWIDTLEGGYIVCPGDMIIEGVAGEYYPCKPDIFNLTYEIAE